MAWNPDQLATAEEAKELATELGSLVGGGVVDIYSPDFGGGYEKPTGVDKAGNKTEWLHFRFANGVEGVNVGLVRCMKGRYRSAWTFMLAREVAYLAEN